MADQRKKQESLQGPERRAGWSYAEEREKWLLKRERIIFTACLGGLAVILVASLTLDLSKNQAIIMALVTGFVSALGLPYALRRQEERRNGA